MIDSLSSSAPLELPLGAHPDALELPHFPTRQQALVWRNWEMVPVERLALVLQTGAQNVLELAREMGLRVPPHVGPQWLSHGYVTLIRQNWHLLPYEQLLTLLDWTPERLDFVLREDDFLWVKLGFLKPKCETLRFAPLSPMQREQTARLRALLQHHFPGASAPEPARPFDFLAALQTPVMPTRRVWNLETARRGEVCLDGSWSVSLPARAGYVADFARDFLASHEARWGAKLRIADKGEMGPRLSLGIEADGANHEPRESHRIEVARDGINVVAGDETGVLRGLQWLERQMEERGGPFLSAGETSRRTRFDLRLIYPYCGVYGDALLDAEADPFPDGLLSQLSKMGVNGVWSQGLLSSLFPWELAPELSAGHEKRLENLRALTRRAARFGIGVYLYLNEPRGLPLRLFETHPALAQVKGVERPAVGVATLCTSTPPIIDFLRDGTAHLFREAPELAGVFTITMSENPTSCHSVGGHGVGAEGCPRCRSRSTAEVVAEVNAAIAQGAHASQPNARVVAWNWGNWPAEAIDELPSGVELMATSEEALPTEIGGVRQTILDYSMSQVGPGPKAREHWKRARARGLKTIAKVQINNTWECSALPYLPVPDLVEEHLHRLDGAGVSGLMLSWTLGGYPAFNLELAARHFWDESTGHSALDELAARRFGAAGEKVRGAWQCFSAAFREFPFHVGVLYTAPQNFGPMNQLHAAPTGFQATMVGLPYDDLETWRAVYPAAVFENQWRKLSQGWKRGLTLLGETREIPLSDDARARLDELERTARAAYLHFYSTYLQVAFVRRRDELAQRGDNQRELQAEIAHLLDEEIGAAKGLHDLARQDSRIGYEASNHYYYTLQDLREKVLNCEHLRQVFAADAFTENAEDALSKEITEDAFVEHAGASV